MRARFGFWGAIALVASACESSSYEQVPGREASSVPPSEEEERETTPSSAEKPGEARGPAPGSRGGPPPTMVATVESLDVGGTERSFVLALPSTYDGARSYPLVLALHGDGGDGASIRAALGLEHVTGQAAIVAYPSGEDQSWNLYDPPDNNRDLSFVVALVDDLRQRFTIPKERVFGVGFSSGAFMLNQLACRRPALLRAIAPIAGGAPNEPRDANASHWDNGYVRCAGQTAGGGPAVIVVHGTADDIVSYDSGDFSAKYWAYVNGCSESRGEPWPIAPCVRYEACPADKDVLLCPIQELGHAIWSEAARAAWAFFEGR